MLPGFVDTHVHFPQVRAIAGLGMPLLDWLEHCALPEEARLADGRYAEAVASEFVAGLAQAGTTTALVFGAHFAPAVEVLFAEAARVGLRITSGLVLSDRLLRDDLLTSPERAYRRAMRWRGDGTAWAATATPSHRGSRSPADGAARLVRLAARRRSGHGSRPTSTRTSLRSRR